MMHIDSRDYWQLASRIASLNQRSIVVHLSEPFYHPDSVNPHVIETNFTWSINVLDSIKSSKAYASFQIIPVESTLSLLSHISTSLDSESIIASILQLARVTYVEVPSISVLKLVGKVIQESEHGSPYEEFNALLNEVYMLKIFLTLSQKSKFPFTKLVSMINRDMELTNLGRLKVAKARLFLRPSCAT